MSRAVGARSLKFKGDPFCRAYPNSYFTFKFVEPMGIAARLCHDTLFFVKDKIDRRTRRRIITQRHGRFVIHILLG